MTQAIPFAEVLDAADHLSAEEQESLIAILRRRLAQAGRLRVAADVEEARNEFAQGQCRTVTPDELLREMTE
jgi:hypothetical protein